MLPRNSERIQKVKGQLFPLDLQHMNVLSCADSNTRVCTARTEPCLKIQWMFEGHLSLCWHGPVALCGALIRWSKTNMGVLGLLRTSHAIQRFITLSVSECIDVLLLFVKSNFFLIPPQGRYDKITVLSSLLLFFSVPIFFLKLCSIIAELTAAPWTAG